MTLTQRIPKRGKVLQYTDKKEEGDGEGFKKI